MRELSLGQILLLNTLLQVVTSSEVFPMQNDGRHVQIHNQEQGYFQEKSFSTGLAKTGRRKRRSPRKLLDILFWPINKSLDLGIQFFGAISDYQAAGRWHGRIPHKGIAKQEVRDPPGEEVPVYEVGSPHVSLHLPGNLYRALMEVGLDVGRVIGVTVWGIARRTERLYNDLKPTFRDLFGADIATNEIEDQKEKF